MEEWELEAQKQLLDFWNYKDEEADLIFIDSNNKHQITLTNRFCKILQLF